MELRRTFRELMRVRLAKFAAVVLGVTIVVAVFAPWLAPYDPVKTKPWDSLHPPSSKYWLGADRLGRDQLSRLIYGARVSLMIGIGGVGIDLGRRGEPCELLPRPARLDGPPRLVPRLSAASRVRRGR